MTHKYEGFLYGHYDSRGGATFVEATDKAKADKQYAASFICEGYEDPKEGFVPKEKIEQEIADFDYIGTAVIESEDEILHGEDIEYKAELSDPERPLWVREVQNGEVVKDSRSAEVEKGPSHVELRVGGECPGGFGESTLGEDAFGVVVLLGGKTAYEV